jgi:tetratricopeptide (TPR) repeat protein
MQKSFNNQKNNLVFIALLVLLGAMVYSNTFFSSFHFDDIKSITENPSIKNLSDTKSIWDFWPTRFVTYFSLALNYHFHKLDVFGYHLVNLFIHLCSALLVWWFSLLTLSAPFFKDDKKLKQNAPLFAFFTALIFIAHPLQTQGITYIIQRAVSLASLFYLLSLCLYIKARLLQQRQENSLRGRACYCGSLLAALLAMFTKEMTITLPFMVLFYEIYFFKNGKKIPWKKLVPFFAALVVIPLTMVWTKSVNFAEMRRVIETTPVNISPGQYLLTQFRVLLTYIRLLFIPLNQNLDYDYPLAKTLFEFPVWASLFLLLFILFIARRLRSGHRLFSFAIFWFFLALLPESSLIPIKDVIFEHRLYLPMVGYALFVVSGVFYLFRDRSIKSVILILSLLTLAYAIKSYNRNTVWRDEEALWNDTVLKSPHKQRPYHNRGKAYQAQEKYDQALLDYNKAIEIDPKIVDTYNNRGNIYQGMGNFDQAISDYGRALEIEPLNGEAYYGRANAWLRKGDFAQAIADFNKAIEIRPDNLKAYNDRGNAYFTQRQYDQAISDYTKAIHIDPRDASLYLNRGTVYQAKGEADQALADYTKAIEITPGDDILYFNRANTWKDKGDLARAIADYTRALEINPNNAGAYHNRAVAYFLTQEYSKSWEDVYSLRRLGRDIHPEILKKLKAASGREE